MTNGLGSTVLLVIGGILVVLSAGLLPLAIEEEPLVLPEDLGEKATVTLDPGQSISRRLRISAKPIDGIVVFSPVAERIDGRLAARLLLDGQVIAETVELRQAYRKDSFHLRLLTARTIVPERSEIEIEIERVSGDPVQLKVAQETGALTLSLLHPVALDFGARQGVVLGVAILLGAVLANRFSRRQWLMASLLLMVIVPLGLSGFLFPVGELGISDWDYYLTTHEAYRRILFEHNAFPFWNPYTCGGTAGLADPEFPLFSPLYVLEGLLGVSLGLRLAVAVSVTVGALGMLALTRRLGLTALAGLLASTIIAFSTTTLLKLTEGHVDMFAAMWIPWIFWAWLKAYREGGALRRSLLTSVFLALTFYQGGLHVLLYVVPALLILSVLVSDKKRGLLVTWQAGLWALGLSAIKLFPVLLWVRQFPDEAYALSTFTLPWLNEIFLERHVHGLTVLPLQGGGWHEYGAYVGPVVIALAVLGLTRLSTSRIVRSLLLGIGLTLLLSSLGPFLKPVLDAVPWLPRSYTSRVIVLTVFGLALLAGYGLDVLKSWSSSRRVAIVRLALVGVVAIDLLSLAYPLSEMAFVLPAELGPEATAPEPIAFTRETYTTRYGSSDFDRATLAARQGYGTLSYCSVLGPKSAVIPLSERDSSYVSFYEGSGTVELVAWSPNRVRVRVDPLRDATVVINTNYADGWLANGQTALSAGGRVGARVGVESRVVEFQYRAPGFTAGWLLTGATLLLALYGISRGIRGH